MSRTDDKPLSETFIQLDANRVTVDTGAFLMQLLRKEFKPENNDGVTPQFEHAEKMKTVRFSSGDWVAIYTVSDSEENATLGYNHTHMTQVYSLDFFTSGDRKHLMRLVEEARRVILDNRKCTFDDVVDVTGVSWMKWGVRSRNFDTTLKNMYRKVVDVEVRWRFRQVQT